MSKTGNELLINCCANFGLDGFGRTAALRITARLKELSVAHHECHKEKNKKEMSK